MKINNKLNNNKTRFPKLIHKINAHILIHKRDANVILNFKFFFFKTNIFRIKKV
jgi:hypothetical protein